MKLLSAVAALLFALVALGQAHSADKARRQPADAGGVSPPASFNNHPLYNSYTGEEARAIAECLRADC